MLNGIYQHRLAIDYLLASEGSINLQIDDGGKVVEEITDKMRKIAHVPIQIKKG
jgi:hypothetical protein